MALMEVPATKSALLALRRQLAFAEEGYALLDQKRELLLAELAARAAGAAKARAGLELKLAAAMAALRSAELAAGSPALDRAAAAAGHGGTVSIKERRLMGLRLPEASAPAPVPPPFGTGSPAGADAAARAFAGLLPAAAELAGLDTACARLARELRKTQRRCNALSKKLIPDCRETIGFLAAALEEREREYFVMLRMVRDRLRAARGQ